MTRAIDAEAAFRLSRTDWLPDTAIGLKIQVFHDGTRDKGVTTPVVLLRRHIAEIANVQLQH
ncbi:hypothetical protein [Rhizobium sp. NFR03]|uniref:hypothetical protein n=1 Tax=Rhizobium sp. NFR03 TaxID=1566263 RepID=UPI0011147390|nr:hypothetical protein [Rhizobium sp. NFR03]